MFKHPLGAEVEARVTKLRGIITARSENLYGCNRYYIQPRVGTDGKVPEGWWVDEDDLLVLSANALETPRKSVGGPMSRSY